MESLGPISLILLFSLGLLLMGWFLLIRIRALLEDKREAPSLLLMQQQVDQLRIQLSQTLDNNTHLVQQSLGQVLGHVNDRLKENAEILQRTMYISAENVYYETIIKDDAEGRRI